MLVNGCTAVAPDTQTGANQAAQRIEISSHRLSSEVTEQLTAYLCGCRRVEVISPVRTNPQNSSHQMQVANALLVNFEDGLKDKWEPSGSLEENLKAKLKLIKDNSLGGLAEVTKSQLSTEI